MVPSVALAPPKNPAKVRAGLAASRARWGPRRVLDIRDLPPEQANLIRLLVDAARSAKETAPTVNETSVRAVEIGGTTDATGQT